MAEARNDRTEADWVFRVDEDEALDPDEYGEVRVVDEGPQSVAEWFSFAEAMEASRIDTVITDDGVWRFRDWGPVPEETYHVDQHPFAETVASGWSGGGMYDRLWGLSRIGDLYFEWYDDQTEFRPLCRGTLDEAVEQSGYFRFTPTGHVVLADVEDDDVVDYLSADGTVVPDDEELDAIRLVRFPLARSLSRDLDSDDEVITIVSELEAAGITEDEARTIMLTGCRRDPVPVLNFIRSLGPASDELVDRRDDIHDLIDWVEGRVETAGISVLEAYDQAPLSTSFPGFATKADGAAIAAENGDIIRAGGYTTASGGFVGLSTQVTAAVDGTKTFTPEELAALPGPSSDRGRGLVTVANETTLIGALRIDDGNVGCLNFASARSVGGGYLNGSRAQEEALCRESALYPCLASQELAYHEVNRAAEDVVGLWTDTMIHSPGVPVFRSPGWDLLDEPFAVSFVTAPAPSFSRVADDAKGLVPATFERRIDLLFRLFQAMGHERVVVGAWGCGAYGNDSAMVAETFRRALVDGGWGRAFDHVHFAVLDVADHPYDRPTFTAFDEVLSGLDLERKADDERNDAVDVPTIEQPAVAPRPSWDRNDPNLGACPKCGVRAFQTVLGGNPMGKAFVNSRCLDCGWVEGRQVSGSGAQSYAARIREEQDEWREKRSPS